MVKLTKGDVFYRTKADRLYLYISSKKILYLSDGNGRYRHKAGVLIEVDPNDFDDVVEIIFNLYDIAKESVKDDK